jgi:hypothetical protein
MAIRVLSKRWSVHPLYIVMYCVVLSHLSGVSLHGLLCMFVKKPGRAIIRLYFEIDGLPMIDWVIGIQFTGQLIRGVDCFFNRQSMLTWVSSMCWCMSTPVTIIIDLCISVLYYCSASHLCIWYRISVGSFACFYVGSSHHQALFWDGWVNLDW